MNFTVSEVVPNLDQQMDELLNFCQEGAHLGVSRHVEYDIVWKFDVLVWQRLPIGVVGCVSGRFAFESPRVVVKQIMGGFAPVRETIESLFHVTR